MNTIIKKAVILCCAIVLQACSTTSPHSDTYNAYRALEKVNQEDKSCLIDAVHFEPNSSRLANDQLQKIGKIRRYIGPTGKVVISGYADATGNPEMNLKLSKHRSDSVRGELILLGVQNDIEDRAKGVRNQLGDNVSHLSRAESRRVEILYCNP